MSVRRPARVSVAVAKAWVLDTSLVVAGTRDPLLGARLAGERRQMARIADGRAKRVYTVAWLAEPPVGVEALGRLVSAVTRTTAAPLLQPR